MSARGVAILGSTGSIGRNTFRVLEALGPEKFRVVALAAGRNVTELVDQISRHPPDLVSVENEDVSNLLKAELLKRRLPLPQIATGEDGLVRVSTHPNADTLVSATVGAVGFVPTLRALEAGKRYYIELIHISGGLDGVSVTWQLPGEDSPATEDTTHRSCPVAASSTPTTATLQLGDQVITVSHAGSHDKAHTDVYVAIADAFHAALRQLRDHASKRRDVKLHA